MEILLYIIMFTIGMLIGSFCMLATYRIPLGKDITHERSFCPKCNHKLDFFDLIPMVSYIALGGKCRYCKEKISIKYFIFELLSGIIFLLLAISMNFNFLTITQNFSLAISKLIYMAFITIYFISLFIIAGIDSEKKEISKKVLLFGMFILGIYILYLYILNKLNVYRYAIYLFFLLLILVLDMVLSKITKKRNYTTSVLLLWMYMLCFTNAEGMIFSTVLTLVLVAEEILSNKFENIKAEEKKELSIPFGLYLIIGNVLFLILNNFLKY